MNYQNYTIKLAIFLIALLVLNNGCSNSKVDSSSDVIVKVSNVEENREINKVEYKYSFDEAIYYKLDHSINFANMKFQDQQTDENQYILKLMLSDIPNEISDPKFISTLNKIGFTKIPISNRADIEELKECFFIKQKPPPAPIPSCGAVYRDILILKEEGVINGIAKLCYSCGSNNLLGGKVIDDTQIDVANLSQINSIIKRSTGIEMIEIKKDQ